jgi:hypothetical protein
MSSRTSRTEFGLKKNRVGLIVGALSGSWHLLWISLVGLGVAQQFLDWIYRLHFLSNPFHVAELSVVTAALLLFISSSGGYLTGWFFALLWNALPRSQENINLNKMNRAA